MKTADKRAELERLLRGLGSAAVAFSGGTDSAFLLKTAHELLGDKAFAVTARMEAAPHGETLEAEEFCRRHGIRQLCFDTDMLNIEGFAANTPERCYICKRAVFSRIKEIAAKNGAAYVIEGSNLDDEGDYRPGLRAIKELGVRSPLKEAGLTKAEIRELSREMGLET
ncbi:MAG: TIGR00268 family protein, partial [Butyrivibrio sp.]|nr:TIGR00268 family protein [Butyrivibrio sp.]